MRRLIVVTLFFLFVCCGREAFACSCIGPPGEQTNVWHKDRLKAHFGYPEYASDTIFLGTVTKIEEDPKPDDDLEAGRKVTFAVEKIWALPRAGGDGDETTITIWTRRNGAMCGFNFGAGERYFVFARYGETTICTPTAQYADDIAADYYKALGQGREPAKPKAAKPKPPAEKPPR